MASEVISLPCRLFVMNLIAGPIRFLHGMRSKLWQHYLCSSHIVADTTEPLDGGIVDGESRACVLHALKTWPKAGLAPRANLVESDA